MPQNGVKWGKVQYKKVQKTPENDQKRAKTDDFLMVAGETRFGRLNECYAL